MNTARIFAVYAVPAAIAAAGSLAACADPLDVAATEASSSSSGGSVAGDGSVDGTSSDPCLQGSTSGGPVEYDDAATFSFNFAELSQSPGLNFCLNGGDYSLLAWPVEVQNSIYPAVPNAGAFYYAGDTYRCGDPAPETMDVTVHSPGWYTLEFLEERTYSVGEGEVTALGHMCYYNEVLYTYTIEVNEDEYNDVTTYELAPPSGPHALGCVSLCRQPGQGCV